MPTEGNSEPTQSAHSYRALVVRLRVQLKHAPGVCTGTVLPKHKRQLFIVTTEESERETKEKVTGIATLNTTEFLYIVSKDVFSVPHKKRLHSQGSNATDMLGPFDRPKRSQVWQVKQKNKPELYGGALVPCGGRVEGDPGPEVDPGPKQDEYVPVTWHSAPAELYEEVAHSYNLSGFWHLTACDPILPLVAVRLCKAYVGLCYTETHVQLLDITGI